MCGDKYWTPKDPLHWWNQVSRVSHKLMTHGRSVGLLSIGDRPAGTAVVVGAQHIITNKHVMEGLSDYNDSTHFWTIGKDVTVTFDKEHSLGEICPYTQYA